MSELTHFDDSGMARMVDVSDKPSTTRIAVASGSISMKPGTLNRIKEGGIKKGDVLGVADVAAVMAAKRTSELIPMCHPVPLAGVEVSFANRENHTDQTAVIDVIVTAKCVGVTGVEMEALTAVSAALLTIYDMCKAIDRGMTISDIELVEKKGGSSGHWRRDL